MSKWGMRESLMLAVAVLLALSVTYCVGKMDGKKAERLADNKGQIQNSDKHTDSVQNRTDSAKHTSDTLVVYRERVREKVVVSHDTISVGDSTYVSKEIAALITADDSTIKALRRSLALQDTLISSLRHGIQLRDERVKLLESEVTPGKFKRIINATKFIAIGAVIGVAVAHR